METNVLGSSSFVVDKHKEHKTFQEEERFAVAKWFADKLEDEKFSPSFDQMRLLFVEYVSDIKLREAGHMEAGVNIFKKEKVGDLEINTVLPGLDKLRIRNRVDIHGGQIADSEVDYFDQFLIPKSTVFPDGVKVDDNSEYYNTLDVVGGKVFERAKSSDEYVKFVKWYLGDYERFIKNIRNPELQNGILGFALSGLDKNVYSGNNLVFCEELVKTIYRISDQKSEEPNDPVVESLFGMPAIAGYYDTRALINRGLVSLQNTKEGEAVAGYVISRSGLPYILNQFRHALYEHNLDLDENIKTKDWLLNFWKSVVPATSDSVITRDVKDFYNIVPEDADPMTEKREGETRVAFLLSTLGSLNVDHNDLICDIAGGNGWLSKRLQDQGYNTVVVDNNENLLKVATDKGVRTVKGDMLEIESALNASNIKPKVEIINGRSIHHIKEISDLNGFKSDIVIFDVLDPLTGAQGERLSRLKSYLVNKHGFDKEWTDKNYWNILGSIDGGKHLMDRFCPPQEWWVDQMNSNGYEVKVTREYNYDNKGTDNLVMVCNNVSDPIKRQKLINEANTRISQRKQEKRKRSNKYFNGVYAELGY